MRPPSIASLGLAVSLSGCAAGASAPDPVAPARSTTHPQLVVFIAVDQLRPDYFERWGSQLTGGYKRLYDGSVFYSRGEQDHAITETAPGHSTMLSGRSPASTGIVTNELGVSDSAATLIGVPGPGASPARFRGTTLYDWMKAADRDVRVLSVSAKDRGAILPIGRAKVPVFWYMFGIFTTSRWYGETLPDWLDRWNARQGAARMAGKSWNLLLDAAAYTEPDSQAWERGGQANLLPKPFTPDSQRVTVQLLATPYVDSLTLDVALDGVQALGLGRRNGRADLLSISLSATDYVGHSYGPDSREMHDQMLRVDHFLGWFMDSLAALVPREQTLYVLTADHGVTSFPEASLARGRMAGRANADTITALADQELQTRYGRSFSLDFNNGLLFGDVEGLRKAGINLDSLSSALASKVGRISGVTRLHTPRSLAAADSTDLDAMRWRRSIPNDFPWLAAASLAPGYIWSFSPNATTHGTTNVDDVRVPILFMGPGLTPGKHQRARTVDIGPTIAALLGISPTEAVEGRVLPEVIPIP